LLLYVENGSGKSSIGKAVRDFLTIGKEAKEFDEYKYRHTDPPNPDRCVILLFDDANVPPLEWKPAGRDAAHQDFKDMTRARGWLDYRAVWRATEVRWGDYVDIFSLLIEEILPSCQRGVSNETFGQTWVRIIEAAAKRPTRNYYGRKEVERLTEEIKSFNKSLEAFLQELQLHGNKFLEEFALRSGMELLWTNGASYDSSSRRNKLSFGIIKLRMCDRDGKPLEKPAEFLNESRITAIGLCLYLAGMARSVPPRRANGSTYPRILVLDDVLLSLDMAHRLPVLRILRDHFRDWQVLLMTCDRAWYEIAKQQLDGWSHHELFTVRVGDYEQPVLREDQDHLYWALEFLEKGHVKAAAVHVRSKFELVLKWACHSLGLAVKYQPEAYKIPASDFWDALKGATIEIAPPPGFHRQPDGAVRWWQPKAIREKVISPELENRIKHAVSWVLNPLSHSQTVDHYRPEIEDAIFAVDELEAAVKRAISLEKAGPVLLREMLLTLLRQRAASLSPPPPPASSAMVQQVNP
jgi:hypothetical protein